MPLDVFFREDILNALRAAHKNTDETSKLVAQLGGSDNPIARAYLRGFQAALATVAESFGVADKLPQFYVLGHPVICDETLPENVIEVRTSDGQTILYEARDDGTVR